MILYVLFVVVEFGFFIEIKIRRVFLNVRNFVKVVYKFVVGFWMWEKFVGFWVCYFWVVCDSVFIVIGMNEVVK